MKKTLALSAVLILGVLGAACPDPATNNSNVKPANNTAPVNTMTPAPVTPANVVPANNSKMENTKTDNTKDNSKTEPTKKP